MLDFEVVGSTTSTAKYTELCSNHYDDIDTSKLNMATVNKLRRFLFGSDIEESKNILCPDERFLRILFGSMGRVFETIVRSCHRHVVDVGVGQTTVDLGSDMRNGYLGYVVPPMKSFVGTCFRKGFPRRGDPPESFDCGAKGCGAAKP